MGKNIMIRAAVSACALLLPAAGYAAPLRSVNGSAQAGLQYRLAGQPGAFSDVVGVSNGRGSTNTTVVLPFDSSNEVTGHPFIFSPKPI